MRAYHPKVSVTRLSSLSLLVVLVAVAPLAVVPATGAAPAAPAARVAPSAIAVSGEGVAMHPAFDPEVQRYAVSTTPDTAGALTVSVQSGGEPVRINGSRTRRGTLPVSGLEPGDEVSVIVGEGADATAYALVYLPPGFPTLAGETSGAVQPGHVLLTLGKWTSPGPFFETAVDRQGVPAYVHQTDNSMDLKRLDNGHYSVARGRGGPDGADIVELDETFTEVSRHRTVGLEHTDGHDALRLADGSRYLMAYEVNDETGLTDSIVQHVAADGEVLFEWNSADHVDIAAETVTGDDHDYAHINSVEVMADGDLLMSFRHFSSVFKVARTAHDGFAVGDVVWRLGGRRSDFSFPDGTGGPCAQHTAHELANGDIMVFDNGAWNLNPLCPDPEDPAGEPVGRTPSRVAVFSLDPVSGVAATVRDIRVNDRYAIFAGSAQPLLGQHVMIGWASSTQAVATEVDAADRVVWELTNTDETKQFTYRAELAEVPDAIDPVAELSFRGGSTLVEGEAPDARASCTDRGGSTLQICDVSGLDTSTTGERTATLTAEDGAGNVTVVQQSYSVVERPVEVRQPDAFAKLKGRAGTVGKGDYRPARRQTLPVTVRKGRRAVAVMAVRNDGDVRDRFRLQEGRRGRAFVVRWGRLPSRTPVLEPGQTWRGRVVLKPRRQARRGQVTRVRLTAVSTAVDEARDAVQIRARVR